jgi:parallel beta-helix repeat protein
MRKLTVFLTITLFFFFIFMSGCVSNHNNKPNQKQTLYVNDDGTTTYTHIQDALDAADTGDTVYVFNGSYYETITLNTSINLIGENTQDTRIILDNDHPKVLDDQYSYIPNDEVGIVHIIAENCTLKGFTIINTANTTKIYEYDVSDVRISSSNNTITDNIILNGKYGVYLFGGVKDNIISFNNISSNDYCGIYVPTYSNENTFYNNDIFNNFYGIRVKGASYNEFYKNNITGGLDGVTMCCGATNNTLYLNAFTNNSGMPAHDTVGKNHWDYLGKGNYWDDYTTRYPNATSTDGIWNIPYSIASDIVIDNFPLVKPFYFTEFKR